MNKTLCNTNNINWIDMISASKVRNYLLEDPLLDWLSFYKIRNIYDTPIQKLENKNINLIKIKKHDIFTNFILNEGVVFEEKVIRLLKNKYNIVQIAESYEAKNFNKFNYTIECMKKGVDIIYQGILHDYKNKLYGCPDILIRSDKINEIFKTNLPDNICSQGSKNLGTPYHYIVIEIKHSTLYFSSNGINLLNCNSVPTYKGQLYIYNKILESIQGYSSDICFIIGKKWSHTKKNVTTKGNNFLEKLGEINFNSYDKLYIEKTNDAIKWLRLMRKEGHKWKLLPRPTKKELYPNMKNDYDSELRKIKNELNNVIHDITSIWMCGVKKRTIALNKNIYSWKDKRCNSKNLKFKKSKTSITLDHILNINRQNRQKLNVNSLQKNNDWRNLGDEVLEFYLDYETINSNFGQCTLNTNNINHDIIFLVGVGYNTNGDWHYNKFLCNNMSIKNEFKVMEDFWKHIDNTLDKYNKSEPIFIHWSNCEPIVYNKFLNRHGHNFKNKQFFDLHKLFKENNIVVKGALNFSLKSIAKAMYQNKLINSTWKQNNCCDGLNAMLLAWKCYQNNLNIKGNEPIIQNIVNYNEIDCKVLFEILNYLRNNY